MKIADMTIKSSLTGRELVPYYDPNEPIKANRNKRVELSRLRATGPQGDQGDSTYQVWLNSGHVGNVHDYLDSLIGAPGDQGTTGLTGNSAYQVWLLAGNTGNAVAYLNSLRGVQGPQGPAGSLHAPLRVNNVSGNVTVNAGTRSTFIISLSGDTVLNVPSQVANGQKLAFDVILNGHALTFGMKMNLVAIPSNDALTEVIVRGTYNSATQAVTGYYTYHQ